MYLLDTRITPVASRLFEIEVWTIDDTTRTLKNTYQPILNIKHVRQGVKIKNPDEIFLFLSDNKRINDLEKIIENDEINLSNIKNNINLVKKKKNNNKFDSNNNSSVIIIGPEDKKTKLIVEFLFNPEYISVGQKVIINDQILKAYGVITKIFK